MSNPYTSVSISNYNDSPPPDDGSQTDANEITWAKHKEKLTDPLKTALESIDSNASSAFDKVWQPVERLDLTNGGSDDLAQSAFTQTLKSGFIYLLAVRAMSSTDASWEAEIEMRNDAGSWLTSGGDYYQTNEVTTQTVESNESRANWLAYNHSGFAGHGAGTAVSFEMLIFGARDVSRTHEIHNSISFTGTTSPRGWGSGIVTAVDGHDLIRVGVSAGTMDGGEAFLYRIKEPS